AAAAPAPAPETAKAPKQGLSFTERHRLDALPAIIARLEAEIAKLSDFLSDAAIYTDAPAKAQKASEALSERQAALDAAEEEWLTLAGKEG
ncbi:MAG: ABC transporter C-terminal domain-containing protein, partial [Paracoccus sp. (in: a-proteobacteria)]|nr:ABC transporter C-terminal domain-containing protein [Paracoccus sp. (in: a-proteobacteria)]